MGRELRDGGWVTETVKIPLSKSNLFTKPITLILTPVKIHNTVLELAWNDVKCELCGSVVMFRK